MSLRETLSRLDVELIDLEDFSCCGEPLKSVNKMLTLTLSARNMAVAEKKGLDVFVPCPMCHLAFSECKKILDSDPEMKKRINKLLEEENLFYTSRVRIMSILDVLYDEIRVDKIKKTVKKPFNNLKAAVHYGCHLIRPSETGRPDDSENPQKIEEILHAIGLETGYYPEKLDCCGGLLNINLPESALTKTGQKLQRVQEQGFDLFVDTCPWCHRQFDAKQKKAGETIAAKLQIPVFYMTQLIGLSMGIPWEQLGLNLNLSPVDKIKTKRG